MNILLIEDEMRVADFVRRGLSAEGWSVQHAPDGETGIEFLEQYSFDVVLLDLMLPGVSGHDVCRKVRARKNITPILMLSALDATEERVDGLRVGADDYLPKPFDFDELVARIEALHRRAGKYTETEDRQVLSHGTITFDKTSLIVTVGDKNLDLSSKERDLLLLFLSNPGRVLSRERILNTVWGMNADPMTNVVDVYVGRLRRKLGDEADRIVTLRNIGYRFE
ncbi:response regulator transcription factor [Actibacterium sp. 188UL27-1]|uniref:response regulator transcription factor n=1 Tax=Actibacterium sp. 188UL27-1 TaxID=2786961 RepID=UPI001958E919|nr:response regulator transcription factor [Actibacterium sp. 188UL27-1]MBM7068763.1 response regulator transcription factor [Actibacterium sp. 188UL27-1]